MSAHGLAVPRGREAPSRAPRAVLRAGPMLAPRAARLAAFVPLAAFGALHWSLLVAPRAGGRMLGAVFAGL